jgi:nucleoside-diphosphate-sugar epimerase
MASDYHEPLNLGTDELLTIDQQAEITCKVAGKTLTFQHDLTKPQGVRGRNSDNTRLREVLGWEPKTTFAEGMAKTYPWIAEQVTSIITDTNPSYRP